MFNQFPSAVEFDLADSVNNAIDWLLSTFGGVFDAISTFVLWVLVRLEDGLIWLPWPLVLVVIGIGAWFATRSKLTTVVLLLLMVMIGGISVRLLRS